MTTIQRGLACFSASVWVGLASRRRASLTRRLGRRIYHTCVLCLGPLAPGPPSPAGGSQQHVLDAAFVDDTVLILMAPSPRTLDGAIDILLQTVQGFYHVLNLGINWDVGKREAFLKYRGKGAAARTRAWRSAPGEPMGIRVPSSSALVHVVPTYKHL